MPDTHLCPGAILHRRLHSTLHTHTLEAAHCVFVLRPGLEASRLSAKAGAACARWLTNTLMSGYFANRTFFKLHHQLGLLDNPDQVGSFLLSVALTKVACRRHT